MVSITDADGGTTTYAYDDLGRRISQSERGTGSMPTLVAWTYDAAGRMTSRTWDDGTQHITSYTYDEAGNRLSASSSSSTVTATYDRLNRPLTVSVTGDSAAATSYTYDLDSPSWTDPSGSYTATLDAFGRQVSLTDPQHAATAWAWSFLSETGAVLVNSTPTADPINALTAYSYDPLGRLAEFTRDSSTTTYGWQAVPNRHSVQVDSDPATTFDFDAANRETDSSLGNIDYDAEGRFTARPGQTLEWSDLGQLTAVKDAATQATIAAYTYDALDRLLTVTHASSTIRFRYAGLTTQVAQVVDDSTSANIYRVANDWSGERLFAWGGSSESFYGTNGHHDVTWTADANGDVSAALLYDPWGDLVDSSGSTLPDFRFQGSWFDPDVELSWVVARWYAPQLAHFISEDALLGQPAEPASRHLYAYAEGEPVGAWDPAGRRSLPTESGWIRTRPGDSPATLALELLGSRKKWPIIFNMNRDTYRQWKWQVSGACVFVPQTRGSARQRCPAGHFSGNELLDDRVKAAKTLNIDWWMLTPDKLKDITERVTGFRNSGSSARYTKNLGNADFVAAEVYAVGGGRATVYRNFISVTGNSLAPPRANRAMTIGQVVFLTDKKWLTDAPLMSHEYIHILQYAADPDFIRHYVDEKDRLKGDTGPRHRFEAIGYLWEAWVTNYWQYGGPTWETPRDIWTAVPTVSDAFATIPRLW